MNKSRASSYFGIFTSISVLIIALSVAYYLVIYLPSKEKIRQKQVELEQQWEEKRSKATSECTEELRAKVARGEMESIKGDVKDLSLFIDTYLENCMRLKGFE